MSGTFNPNSKSNTDPEEKNRWATRWETFADAQRLYGRQFVIDVAAQQATSKVGNAYFGPDHTREDWRDALAIDWPSDWWCNPPFDSKIAFVEHARKQQAAGRSGMMLLPYEPCSNWWAALLDENVIIYEPDGRIGFYKPDGKTKRDGVNFPSALICFPAHHIGKAIRVRYKRTKSPRIKKEKPA